MAALDGHTWMKPNRSGVLAAMIMRSPPVLVVLGLSLGAAFLGCRQAQLAPILAPDPVTTSPPVVVDASIMAEPDRVAEAATDAAKPTTEVSARTATCAPLPEPDANAAQRNLDLDHDGISDFLIPTDCDGRQNCTIHLFLNHDPCPVPLGDIGAEPSVLSRGIYDLAVMPLTSHGIALIHTSEGGHHSQDEVVWAWSGNGWTKVSEVWTWWGHDAGRQGGITRAAGTVCIDAAAPTAILDVDGDGTLDQIHHINYASPDNRSRESESWVLLAKGNCLRPVAVLADGIVEIAGRPAPRAPAVLRVSEVGKERARIEYRFEAGPDGIALATSRTCARSGSCGAWAAFEKLPERNNE
jgi:hypothetical protein